MHELLENEARSAGLRRRDVSLQTVNHRRMELWALAVSVVTTIAVIASIAPGRMTGLLADTPSSTVRIALGLLAFVFVAYVCEKEVHLRRLQEVLLDERILTRAFAERAEQLVQLAEGARAVNADLDIDHVFARLLDRALEMMDAPVGSVLVVDSGRRASESTASLRAACVRGGGRAIGEEVSLRHGPVAEAVRNGRAMIAEDEDSTSRLIVPLVHRGDVLGALEVSAAEGRVFGEYEIQVLSVFADYVSVSIANARILSDERTRVAELTKLDEMKSEFLSTVSHELKTPLTSIIGSASVMRRAPLSDAERDEFLESIDRQARRLAEMVDQLLIAGRVEEERPDPHVSTDLVALARLVASDFERGGRRVELDLPSTCFVRCADGPLQQILVNLLDNAFKYGATPVRLEVATRGAMVVCSVLDRGPGVPADSRELIFQRFHRLDATGTKPGMGLGLPIVRQIAESVGGRSWVDVRPGGGAAVRVTLPTAGTSPSTHDAAGTSDRLGNRTAVEAI